MSDLRLEPGICSLCWGARGAGEMLQYGSKREGEGGRSFRERWCSTSEGYDLRFERSET